MKLTVFQSDEGDCLLVESRDGRRMLVDGGKTGSFHAHVAPALSALDRLDLVVVSHIDADHIEGVLALMDDTLDWRVHDFQLRQGNAKHPQPRQPRPPQVGELWHNAFSEQVDQDTGPIAGLLAASAARLDFGDGNGDAALAARHRDLATSVAQGIRLSRRVSAEQLGIPLNQAFDHKLALVRDDGRRFPLGSLELTVIGPFAADLDTLRKEWKAWLKANQSTLEKIRRDMRGDVQRLGNGEIDGFRASLALQATELGDRTQVTAPNLASLMLMAREDGKTVLLTGDGHADDILKGLRHAKAITARGHLHVDVLKVQHHGSEFNITPEFGRRITANDYVFCGNGAYQNPDLRTLALILDERGDRGPCRFWFNSSPDAADGADNKAQMRKVRDFVAARTDPGFSYRFLDDDSFELEL